MVKIRQFQKSSGAIAPLDTRPNGAAVLIILSTVVCMHKSYINMKLKFESSSNNLIHRHVCLVLLNPYSGYQVKIEELETAKTHKKIIKYQK